MKARPYTLIAGILLATVGTGFGQTEFVRMPDLTNNATRSLGCAWGDYNGDGYVDLVVANGAHLGSEVLDNYCPATDLTQLAGKPSKKGK